MVLTPVWATGHATVVVREDAEEAPPSTELSYSRLCHRTDDGWRIIRDIASANAPPSGVPQSGLPGPILRPGNVLGLYPDRTATPSTAAIRAARSTSMIQLTSIDVDSTGSPCAAPRPVPPRGLLGNGQKSPPVTSWVSPP